MVKQKLTLSIDKEILTKAKQSQINLSSFLEIRLVDYLMVKKCSRRDSNPSSWLERPVLESSNTLAQPVLDTYMLRRRMEGITEGWASDIEFWLQGFLDYVNWELDEENTFHYLEQLKDNYSTSS